MKNRPSMAADSGFTLLEILIAVVLLSIVMTALFSSFRAFALSSDKIKNDITRDERIQGALKRIQLDLQGLFVLQEPRYQKPEFNDDPDPFRFICENESIDGHTAATLVFASLAHACTGSDSRSGVARIAYYVKKDKDNKYNLYRADALYPFPDEVQSCADPILCRDITGFEATFTNAGGDEYETWNSDDDEFDYVVPSGVNLKITFAPDSNGQEQVFQTFILIASGRDAIE